MNKHLFPLGLIGFATGVLSFAFREFLLLPGVLFGIGVGLYFMIARGSGAAKVAVWVLVSTAAYHIALRALGFVNAIPVEQLRTALQGTPWSFFFAGLAGAAVVTVGYHALLSALQKWAFIALPLLGAVLAVISITLVPIVQGTQNNGPLMALFIIWQTGMAIGLAVSGQELQGKKRS